MTPPPRRPGCQSEASIGSATPCRYGWSRGVRVIGLFDYFSGQDAQNAADAQKAGIQQGYANLTPFFSQGRDALTGALGTGTGALNTALGNATNAYGSGLTGATGALGQSLANSTAPFQTNLQQAQAGQAQYGNALGLGGAAGNAQALSGFQNNPGYQFQMDQMMQNLLRNQQATGQANSGATNVDTLQQASGLANQGWQSYLQNLQPYIGASNAAAQGIAGANQNYGNQVAGANLGTASGLAGTNVNVGQLLAALNQGTGSQLNQSLQGQGNAAYGAATGIGNAQANADLAQYTASGNLWNTLLGGANAAAKIAAA
jgi:hypothetical protein